MRESELARAKTCFQMMALSAGFSLIKSLLPGSNSLLDGLLSLASAVLALIAIWRLREVEDGYRRAFRVEVIGVLVIVVGAVSVVGTAYANAVGLTIALALLVAVLPVILGGIFQYLFCSATGRLMEEVGAPQEAIWSGWMWKIYVVYAVAGVLGAILVLIQVVPELISTMVSWMGLAVNVLQIVYYFICSRALPAK